MKKKEKHFTIRLPYDLYDFYLKKTIKKSSEVGKIIKLSEIIREVLETNKHGN
jgi:hypothetical protein